MKASASHEAMTLMNMKSNAVSGPAKVRATSTNNLMSLPQTREKEGTTDLTAKNVGLGKKESVRCHSSTTKQCDGGGSMPAKSCLYESSDFCIQ